MSYEFKQFHWAKDIELSQYLQPADLAQALDMLASHGGRARVVAGGTDLIPSLRQRDMRLEALVDVSRLPGMDGIELKDDVVTLGAGVTHAQAAASPIIREKAGLLAQGAASVGSPQIRNVGTVAGNLIAGQPAADTSLPLLALDAWVNIASPEGQRVVPLASFFLGKGKTQLDPSREILTSVQFKALGPGLGGSYQRLAKRKAMTLPMLVAAVLVGVDAQRRVFSHAAIALGPVAPAPFRASLAEAVLGGAPVSAATVAAAAETAMQESNPRDSCLRGSCDYRLEMVKVFVRRGIEAALAQAGCTLD
jgi:carbon-monoxide dehydrogenase medium subunit